MSNDIEQARELLAAELRKDGSPVVAQYVLDGHDDGCTAMRAIAAALRAVPEAFDPFTPKWPAGLQQDHVYQLPCDDKGRSNANWLQVYVAQDSDVHVMMQDWEDILEKGSSPNPLPTLRVRTYFGGGRNHRTHQALLWLAQAIRLDMEEKAAPVPLATVQPPRDLRTKLGDA